MCGIAGLLDLSRRTSAEEMRSVATEMADALSHRGPDDAGVWVDEDSGIAFGHRRLAVIDLTAQGHQPMHSACGRFVLAYNGEIYNFRHLRADLEAAGHRFRGSSDTEVLLGAISEWGLESALTKCNGMFAFALWDRRDRRLHLVRDRVGEKPLYYGLSGDLLLFGSELKALRAHPSFDGEIDRDALALYLRHNCVPAPWSIFRATRKLPPASVLTIDISERRLTREPVRYWSALEVAERGANDPLELSEEEATDALEELLKEAVGLRMESDVPLGAFLSGGIDSSTVVSLMQSQASRPVSTFTIGSTASDYDESSDARAVAQHLGTNHTELLVTPDEAISVIPRLPTLYDEPFGDSSQIPTFLVAELARRHVTVVLSGDGGDELFGGYNRYPWVPAVWRRIGRLPGGARKALARALLAVPPRSWDRLAQALPPSVRPRIPATKIEKLAEIMPTDGPQASYLRLASHWHDPSHLVRSSQEPVTLLSDIEAWPALPDISRQMMSLDTVTYLPDDILVKVDRASMGVSLEARVPLLDHRIVEFAARLPPAMTIRGRQGKWLLRQVLYRHVPQQIIDRPKTGFGFPLGEWLRGPLRPWAEELLDARRLHAEGFFDAGPIRHAWAEHVSGSRDREHRLWDVLMFEAWLEHQRKPASAIG